MTRQQKMAVLVPIGGVALIAVLVAVIVGFSEPSKGAEKTMPTDGSNGTVDDPDLKELAGGMKYRDLKVGDGEEAKADSTVVMHYTGWLTDGTVFDSSEKQGQPLESPLAGLIQGWQIGVPGMKVGGVRKLVIPPSLGYGNRASGKIPANSTLIFEITLLGVK